MVQTRIQHLSSELRSRTTKVIVIHKRNDLRIEDRQEAATPQSGEVRIDIIRGGT